MELNLSKEQSTICNNLLDWVDSFNSSMSPSPKKRYIVLGGFAGTGKTYLASKFRVLLNEYYGEKFKVGFCTFTGKAVSVLKKKLEEAGGLFKQDEISTIHSLIYIPVYHKNEKGEKLLIGWKKTETLDHFKLIIIDEGSMVNKVIWDDLSSYNIPIIIIGDHFQLPPIDGKFNIMENPDLTINEIQRQQSDELINFSNYVRQNGRTGSYPIWISTNKTIIKMDWRNKATKEFIEKKIPWKNQDDLKNYQILCGMNNTRVILNNMARKYKFTNPTENPYPGDRLVCLKNNHQTKLMNGQMGTLVWNLPAEKDFQTMSVNLDDSEELYNTLVHLYCFGKISYNDMWEKVFEKNKKRLPRLLKESNSAELDIFDFAYAISVHRAQGSEWDKVVLIEERNSYQDDDNWARWLYTAVTRAKQKIVIITNFY